MKTLVVALVMTSCGGCESTSSPAPRSDAGAKTDASKSDAAVVQTSFDDLPDAGPADLDARGKHLLEAISANDPALAADIVMPREAYIAARDTADPGGLYDTKFKSTFASHLAHIHRREHGVDHAIFVSFDLQNPSRVPPKKHDWKEPLWRAARCTLTFTIDGRVRRLEIGEMVAWRGNWYVARLH
jgi:hypothetical protein